MAAKVTVGTTNKLIVLNSGITALDVQVDLYSDLKEDWQADANMMKMVFPFDTAGGDPIGGGLLVGAFFFLRNDLGWRIRPHEANHELIISGNLYPKNSALPLFTPTLGNYTCSIIVERSSLTQNAELTPAIKAKTDLLPDGIKKNAALNNFTFVMLDASDHVTPKTGLTVTAQRAIDGGGFSATANSPSEVGNGVYKINLAASDLAGDVVTLRFTASGADPRIVTVLTQQ